MQILYMDSLSPGEIPNSAFRFKKNMAVYQTGNSDTEKNLDKSCFTSNLVFSELFRCNWINTKDKQLYTRGCLWSPDGTCVLTAINLDGMYVLELPSDVYEARVLCRKKTLDVLQSATHVKEGGAVYDYCWYPLMNRTIPQTCCWIATRQHEPIHMWNKFDGKLRCSYRGYNAKDEMETALSVAFSSDGKKILGGYKKSIKIFDTSIPGRDFAVIDTKNPCSCFDLHSSHKELVITGSWKATIDLYDLRSPKLGCLVTLKHHVGGVTHLKFAKDGRFLFSGARKDNQVIEWDTRNFSIPLKILKRDVITNQKIYFDLCASGQWLMSGDTSGVMHAWDVNNNFNEYLFSLHHDCCNGVSAHPSKSLLASTAGQYHFLTQQEKNGKKAKMYENSFIIWRYGKVFE